MKRAMSLIRSALPGGMGVRGWLRRLGASLGLARGRTEIVFTDIYRGNLWYDPESVSGRGSTLERTAAVRAALPALLRELGARSLLDAPCGDFNWMRHVDLSGVSYAGADVVPDLIERNRQLYGGEGRAFLHLDITRDALPRADVVMCRDCLIHLSFADARRALRNFKASGSTYLLATTHAGVTENEDAPTGGWRSLNLRLPPFDFPAPARTIVEDPALEKHLALWRLDEL